MPEPDINVQTKPALELNTTLEREFRSKYTKSLVGGTMAAVSSVSVTGNTYVDGLLTGAKWASGSLTYSFPGSGSLYGSYPSNEPSSGFLAFNAAQQQAITKILKNYAAVANLQFSQVTESSSTHAIIR